MEAKIEKLKKFNLRMGQTLLDLENILSEKFPIKIKVGKHYGALS